MKRKARQSVTRDVELEPVITFLRDLGREHPARLHGQCPTCGHYGDDCHGSRAAGLLADLTGERSREGLCEHGIALGSGYCPACYPDQ